MSNQNQSGQNQGSQQRQGGQHQGDQGQQHTQHDDRKGQQGSQGGSNQQSGSQVNKDQMGKDNKSQGSQR